MNDGGWRDLVGFAEKMLHSLVDVFHDGAFTGNPLAVVFDGDDLSTSTTVVDVTHAGDVRAATEAAVTDLGRIDILVNNAGITGGNAVTWEFSPANP